MSNDWVAKDYDGGATSTTLDGAIGGAVLTITVTSGSGLPDGGSGPFVLAIDRGGTEEKILVTSRTGNVLTVAERGYDGTAATAHSDLDTVDHVIDALSMKQTNRLANAMESEGSMAYRGSGNQYLELALGAVGLPLLSGASAPAYGQLGSAGIADEAITIDHLAAALLQLLNPAGIIQATCGATADTGYLLLDGSSHADADDAYPALWARVPASWKSGSTLNLPDARGKTLFMDDAAGVFTLGGTGGANTITAVPAHVHSMEHDHPTATSTGGTAHTHTQSAHTHTQTAHNHSITQTYGAFGNSGGVRNTITSSGDTALTVSSIAPTISSDTPPALGNESAHTHDVNIPNFTGNTASFGDASVSVLNAHLTINWQIKAH